MTQADRTSLRRPGTLALAITLALLSTASAHAQDRQDGKVETTAASSAEAEAKDLDTVIVTGSRIRREAGFDGPAPVTSISAETIRSSGHTQIADLMNQLPSFAVSQSDQTSNNPDVGNVGINALDLRGMGVQRTLTMVDGRRQVPSIPGTSGVDVSMLPASLIERVEVMTGGASALYGADAVNGVVNFILKRDFEGLNANVRYSNSSRGDMPNFNGDVLFGRNFADNRGNFTLYGFWEKDDGDVSGQDRPWTANGTPLYERPGTGSKYVITEGNRNFYDAPNANIVMGNCGPSNQIDCLYTFDANGNLRRPTLGPGGLVNYDTSRLTNGDALLQQGRTNGGEYGGRYDNWYLSVPSDRQSVRSTLNFDFNESLRFFGSLSYSQSQSRSVGRALAAYGSGGSESVPFDSPFITQEMIDANGGPFTENISFARHFDNDVGLISTEYKRKLLQVVGGLEGDFSLFGRAWNYSGYLSYGRSNERVRSRNAASYDRLIEGLNSTTDSAGNAVCNGSWVWNGSAYDWAAPSAGCVAINPFKQLTPGMVDWLTYDTDWSDTTMTQKVASAYASGGLFDLPAGEVQLVVGAEYRKESSDIGVTPQFNPDDPRYDPTLGVTETPLVGQYSVKEIFGELHIPLLADLPGAQHLALDLAGRVSDYNLAGRTATSKIGLEWTPIEDITLRGTWGKAIRAPNIAEMYTADSVSGLWVYDPCNDYSVENRTDRTQYTAANCAAIAPSDTTTYWQWRDIVSSGNTGLKPETAKTTTWGVVLRPRFVNNLSVSADYYRIDLRGVIAELDPQAILNRCVDQASLDNPFCDMVTRNNTGDLVEVAVQQLNLSQSIARGVDINASWFQMLPNGNRVSIDLSYGRILQRTDVADPTNPSDAWDYVGLFGTPKWKGATRFGWSNESSQVSWNLRHVSRMRAGETYTEENTQRPWAGNTFYSDVYFSHKITPKLSVYAGLNNVFDRSPPRIPGGEAGGANFNQAIAGYQAGLYDVIGRTYYGGLRLSL
ncbi:TonB-dependent receptor [Stenotrophomonas sp. SY1]|uniref:TonB-dependent receptor plug domain-containing protein n=1 Tax=Stenotrophomonas sp. SY1 TaxID=477235 RepID=UPI001E5E2D72|nr:TonB-dependent receptor [Stenotrophomonas sp. SY1]MCD9088585.1 TonB-dependent receptor [Stenotrophomonas sp. SY1]